MANLINFFYFLPLSPTFIHKTEKFNFNCAKMLVLRVQLNSSKDEKVILSSTKGEFVGIF